MGRTPSNLGHPVFHSFIDITYVAITQTSLHLVCLIFFLFLFFMHFRHSLPPTRSHIRTFITGKNIFSRFAYSAFKILLLLSLFKLLDSIVADMNTVRRLCLPPLHHFSCTIYFMNAFYCFELWIVSDLHENSNLIRRCVKCVHWLCVFISIRNYWNAKMPFTYILSI